MKKVVTAVTGSASSQPLIAFLSIKDVQSALGGKSRSTIYRWISEGQFPQPVKIGGNSVAWPIETLVEWRNSVIGEGR